MRDFLGALEKKGMLRRIPKPVDRMSEPAALAKWMFQALPEERRFGMYFEKVKGSTIPLVTAALGANTAAYATALDVPVEDINAAWVKAYRNPIPPKAVEKGRCQEVVIQGKDIRLSYLPIPVWTPGKDKGPYVTTIVLTKNHDTGVQNMGTYRTMVRDETALVSNLRPGGQGGYNNMMTWHEKGKPAPVAWVIAAPPAVHLAALANVPLEVDEVTIAGGMMGEGVPMVKCTMSDLLVPADSEIIIEGEVHPGETDIEGPFGEFVGFMGPVEHRPVVRVTAITHRKDPIYYGYSSQMPPSESVAMQSLTNAGLMLKALRHDFSETGVSDLFIDLTYGAQLGHVVVAMKPSYPGHAKKVGRLVAAMAPIKRVTIVDDDIDIRDYSHVDWAMNARYNPARDTILIDDVYYRVRPGQICLDPSVFSPTSSDTMASKVICDATLKVDAGTFSLPTKEVMAKALGLWKEVGLPEFEIPKRARLRIDRP